MHHHLRAARAHTGPSSRSDSRRSPRRELPDDRVGDRSERAVEDHVQRLVVEVRQDLPRPLVTVAGELDLDSAGLLTAMLDHVRRRHRMQRSAVRRDEVDVDLAGITFADSHGLAPVLDDRVRVVAASQPVGRLLRLLRDPTLSDPRRLPRSESRTA